jgi:hypothetical protein
MPIDPDLELNDALVAAGAAVMNLVVALRAQVAALEDRLMQLEREVRAPDPPPPPPS